MFKMMHQPAFTINPPSNTTTRTGIPAQMAEVAGAVVNASFCIAEPPCRPKLMAELISPEKIATMIPFLKLNSATAFFFSASGNSFSLDMPARPTRTIPATDTTAAATETRPADVPNMAATAACPLSMGGISVPAAEVSPAPMASPNPTPR